MRPKRVIRQPLPQTEGRPWTGWGAAITALIVRAHGTPTPSMIDRFIGWSRACRAASPPLFMMVSVAGEVRRHARHINESWQSAAWLQKLRSAHVPIYAYIPSRVLQRYPTIAGLQPAFLHACKAAQSGSSCVLNVAYAEHVTSTLLWWTEMNLAGRLTCSRNDSESSTSSGGGNSSGSGGSRGSLLPLQSLWIVEQDVVTSRDKDVVAMLTSYASDPADLICAKALHRGTSWHKTVATAAFDRAYPTAVRVVCEEFVQRWSCKLLDVLLEAARQGQHGWSEMSVPTVARAAQLGVGTLRQEHVGFLFSTGGGGVRSPAKYLWPRADNQSDIVAIPRVGHLSSGTERHQELFQRSITREGGSRFYHPIKF